MTIGSQIQIIDVMQSEERQKELGWREEWKAAQRLLTSSEKQRRGAQDCDGVRELERKNSRTMAARVGGGFNYMTDQVDLGLESLFEHKSMVPWTACSDTDAGGPKIPVWEAQQGPPRLPPRREPLNHSSSSSSANIWEPLPALRAPPGRKHSARRQPPVAVGNPWQKPARKHTAHGGYPSGHGGSSARGPSSARPASADRAAGVRAPSPGKWRSTGQRSKSPTSSRERRKPPAPEHRLPALSLGQVQPAAPSAPPQLPIDPRLERRWSF